MRTMEDVDAWYEAEMNRARVEGAIEEKQRQQQTIALNLLRKNISLDTISEATGLTIEQLQVLRLQPGNN